MLGFTGKNKQKCESFYYTRMAWNIKRRNVAYLFCRPRPILQFCSRATNSKKMSLF